MKKHHYTMSVTWTGNKGEGTKGYRSYDRSHTISHEGKPAILGSSDPAFRGDPARYSPEDMLLASIASCHMLWFLHLSSDAGIVVTEYIDHAEGTMIETADGGGRFEEVVLKPRISIAGNPGAAAVDAVHHQANKVCFIANSCNFPIRHMAEYIFDAVL